MNRFALPVEKQPGRRPARRRKWLPARRLLDVLDGDVGLGGESLGICDCHGMIQEAEANLGRLEHSSGEQYVCPYEMAAANASLKRKHQSFQRLERA